MTEPIEHDRRSSDQWIRDACKATTDDVHKLRSEVTKAKKDLADLRVEMVKDIADLRAEMVKSVTDLRSELATFMDNVLRSIPNRSPKQHLDSHVVIDDDILARRKRAAYWLDIRNAAVKAVVVGGVLSVLGFLSGIFALGASTQLGLWVREVPPKVILDVTKEKTK